MRSTSAAAVTGPSHEGGIAKTSLIIFLFFVLLEGSAGILAASDRGFVDQWSRFDEMLQVQERGPSGYRRRVELPFSVLRTYSGTLAVPPEAEPVEKVLVLSRQQERAILLVLPRNTLGTDAYLSEEFKQALARCASARSWLVTIPENTWTPIELNPYCTMDYDESGILLDLYWTRSSTRPLIDISTNGFRCVSHTLYSWDAKTGYRSVAQKCTGSRPRQSYSLNSRMRQVYPPGGEPEGKSGQLKPWSVD